MRKPDENQGRNLNTILLTIDVEDWFQVENFKAYIPRPTWDSKALRVEKCVHRLLDFFDSKSDTLTRGWPNCSIGATFFVLGWIAERLPEMVRTIRRRGHEVASHGYHHELSNKMPVSSLAKDLERSKKLLEDVTGEAVCGYRAPSFAIDQHVLQEIKQAGYQYDSSFNSFSGHGRYGTINLSHAHKKGACYQLDPGFYELPISNLKFREKVFPLGGGGYFRLFPFFFFKRGMQSVLRKDKAFIYYAHPWEFDPLQPRVRQASIGFRFRHYVNLHKTLDKLAALIEAFSNSAFMTSSDYIQKQYPLK